MTIAGKLTMTLSLTIPHPHEPIEVDVDFETHLDGTEWDDLEMEAHNPTWDRSMYCQCQNAAIETHIAANDLAPLAVEKAWAKFDRDGWKWRRKNRGRYVECD